MTEEAYRELAGRYLSPSQIELDLNLHARRNDLIGATVLLEGLDDALFEKLSVLEGDLAPLFSPKNHAIAISSSYRRLWQSMFWFYSAHFTVLPVLITIPIFAILGFGIPSVIYHQTSKQSIIEQLREAE